VKLCALCGKKVKAHHRVTQRKTRSETLDRKLHTLRNH
jgi:hypothetical protein